MAAAQRKKKTDKSSNRGSNNDEDITAASSSSAAATKASSSGSLEEQLDRALEAVERQRRNARQLHIQWRTHLLRMSYIVLMVTLHQAQTPSTSCVKEIKQWNILVENTHTEDSPSNMLISGAQAFRFVLNHSIVEILGILCCGFLLWCLNKPLPPNGNDFTTVPYQLSCAVIPMIVTMYFGAKFQSNSNGHADPSSYLPLLLEDSDIGGCLDSYRATIPQEFHSQVMSTLRAQRQPEESEPSQSLPLLTSTTTSSRTMPVVLIFHVMTSICLFFMQYQISQLDGNVQKIYDLQRDLKKAKADKRSNKK